MKLAVVIDNSIGAGGGYDQALNALIQIHRLSKDSFDLIALTQDRRNIDILKKLNINVIFYKRNFIDKFIAKMVESNIWHFIQRQVNIIGPFEKKLINNNVDLVYFVTPSSLGLALQKINFITTVWDLCHRDNPEFPEIRERGEFFNREYLYRNLLSFAFLVICDSKKLAELASFRYGVDIEKFVPMPFGASPLHDTRERKSLEEIQIKYNLPSQYLYYPAQFWAHKNHIRILDALCILRDVHKLKVFLVLSGKDYGNLTLIKKYITKRKLDSQVLILGFVPSNEVKSLYEGSSGVIVPTYFGQTNLPPLEAWAAKVPLIYSRNFSEQAGDAAEFIDYDDSESIANAILNIKERTRYDSLVKNGILRLNKINDERKHAESIFFTKLKNFSKRLALWKKLED